MSAYEGSPLRASDRAYAALRADIVQWRLPPGSVLAEVQQSERLGVSRTPLREALARLTAEGLTEGQRGRGVVVTDISLHQVRELFELRATLECRAAELASERGDREVFGQLTAELVDAAGPLNDADPTRAAYYELVGRLDAAIDAAVGNSYLAQALKSLRVHLVRVRRLSQDNPGRLLAAALEHATIARAIAKGNARVASAATTVHLDNSLDHLLSANPR